MFYLCKKIKVVFLKHPVHILLAPLDWGLGHTTRCIPIVHQLLKTGAKVTIAANHTQINYLQKELQYDLQQINYIYVKGYDIKYAAGSTSLILLLLLQIPKIIYRIIAEHFWLQQVVQKLAIDVVISDNRYGFFTKKCTSIFITHQVQIQTPFASKLVNKINHYFIKNFDECWVPDLPNPNNLAGNLSETNIANKKYIGIISRFYSPIDCKIMYKKNILCILSGPEPQRSILANIVATQLQGTNYLVTIIGDVTQKPKIYTANIKLLPTQSQAEIQSLVATNAILISRSGYTTLMDLAMWNRAAVLIPTPGQTEQEYLGNYVQQKKWHLVANQKNIDLQKIIKEFNSNHFTQITLSENNYLQLAITNLLATKH
jgi:spore coat polysaccharide biosynthesis predicted glycosyltransferase SpsG